MAGIFTELVIREMTYKGRSFQIVMELNDTSGWNDRTPRTVTIRRLYTRGDLGVFKARGFVNLKAAPLGVATMEVDDKAQASRADYASLTVDIWKAAHPVTGKPIQCKENFDPFRFRPTPRAKAVQTKAF